MPKVWCKCGYVFDLSTAPCEEEYLLVSEIVIDDLIDSSEHSANDVIEILTQRGRHALECPRCRNMYVQDTVEEEHYVLFVPLSSDNSSASGDDD